jgi:hypothetical protein
MTEEFPMLIQDIFQRHEYNHNNRLFKKYNDCYFKRISNDTPCNLINKYLTIKITQYESFCCIGIHKKIPLSVKDKDAFVYEYIGRHDYNTRINYMKLVENYQTLPLDFPQNHIEQYLLNEYVSKDICSFMCSFEEPKF